jgi:predicted nucleotidyltransferase
MTDLGVLDVMRWVPGLETDDAFSRLAADAIEATVFGVRVRVCALEALRAMKRAAGRPIDEQDLEALG